MRLRRRKERLPSGTTMDIPADVTDEARRIMIERMQEHLHRHPVHVYRRDEQGRLLTFTFREVLISDITMPEQGQVQ